MAVPKQRHIAQICNLGVRAAASDLFYSGALSLFRPERLGGLRKTGKGRGLCSPFIVLLYHRVNPDNDPFSPALSVKAFEAQVKFLVANFRVRSLGDIITNIRQGLGVTPGTIALTFDDGYRDNYVYAHPILNRYKCPATLFAATSYIGTEKVMWNDKLALAVKCSRKKTITMPGFKNALPLTSVVERFRALEQILETLKVLPESNKLALVEEILNCLCNEKPKSGPLMLSWSELKQMACQGWEVGSHTANHVILTRVPFGQAKEEIQASGSILERELGRPIRLFAYPNGKTSDYDTAIKSFLKELGYIGALTTIDKLNAHDVDLFELGRKSPWEESLFRFAVRLGRSFLRGS